MRMSIISYHFIFRIHYCNSTCGQNDLTFGLLHTSHEQVIKLIPDILSQFFQAE